MDSYDIFHVNIASDNELLYILYITRESSREQWTTRLRVYDEKMEFLKHINFDEAEVMMDSRTSITRVFGDYFYIRNFNSESILGHIDEEGYLSVTEHWHRSPFDLDSAIYPDLGPKRPTFQLALNSCVETNFRLFYENFIGNNILLFNTGTGEMHEIALELDEGYFINYALSGEGAALLAVTTFDDFVDRFYLLNFSIKV